VALDGARAVGYREVADGGDPGGPYWATHMKDTRSRPARLDWRAIERDLQEQGFARTPPLLGPAECARLIRLFADDRRFRSRIDLARYRFGVGSYKYFARPLPRVVARLRARLYAGLAPLANAWMEALGSAERYPGDLESFLARCARAGQTRPTPLLLHYEAGGHNCLHQDLYGALAFPLQVTCMLSQRGEEFTGGEFLLVEQRPRAQSRGEVVVLERGEAVVFPSCHRPVAGSRGWYRVTVRHGTGRVLTGERYTLGLIFHDAR
jgi:hypothetical protein